MTTSHDMEISVERVISRPGVEEYEGMSCKCSNEPVTVTQSPKGLKILLALLDQLSFFCEEWM